jgi:hypothetical protein
MRVLFLALALVTQGPENDPPIGEGGGDGWYLPYGVVVEDRFFTTSVYDTIALDGQTMPTKVKMVTTNQMFLISPPSYHLTIYSNAQGIPDQVKSGQMNSSATTDGGIRIFEATKVLRHLFVVEGQSLDFKLEVTFNYSNYFNNYTRKYTLEGVVTGGLED